MPVKCPHCGSGKARKNGISNNGKRRFLCLNESCPHKTFVESYTYKAYYPFIHAPIFFMTVNGNGMCAIARTLGIAKDTVTDALRNIEPLFWRVNYDCLNARKNGGVSIGIVPVREAEMDEMRGFAGDTSNRYRLWRAIDHNTGEPPAFHFGTREHKTQDALLEVLKPFNINRVYSDDHFAYKFRITESEVVTGKKNTQKIERKRLSLRTWRTRLVRKGICFSKTE